MSFDAQKLLALLPALYRVRDQAQATVTPGWLDPERRATLAALENAPSLTPEQSAERDALRQEASVGPLASLLAVFAEQIAVLEEDLEQLYDDQFIETCAEWLAPYIGALVGYRALHGVVPSVSSPRAEVAHTIALRRRKGTLAVIEQIASDVTGWNARAVEFFRLLATTQYMNHVRLENRATPDLRNWEALERAGTAFDALARSVDVRRIAGGRGRYNIPNVGVFLWRIPARPLRRAPAVPVDARRFRFHPLGVDQPLYTQPESEDQLTQLATPLNVPLPISRRVLDARLGDYYGDDDQPRSLRLYQGTSGPGVPVPVSAVCVCDLSDDGASWAHLSDTKFAVDPVLGRVALPSGMPDGTRLWVDFHYGFAGDLGGGEYDRPELAAASESAAVLAVPSAAYPTLQAALTALNGRGTIEIQDSGRYAETLALVANGTLEIRAAKNRWPTLLLGGELTLQGGPGSEIRLDGLLIQGHALRVPAANNQLAKLTLRHSTLVPGLALTPDGTPLAPGQPSLIVELDELALELDHAITGALRVAATATIEIDDSIVDAGASTNVAYAGLDGAAPGGALTLRASTVLGKLTALELPLAENAILLAELAPNDTWGAPVVAARRQQGCVRFSYLPDSARVPRRYRCLPESASAPELALPVFTSLRYGHPAYAQLAPSSGSELMTGAADEGQPGAFHAAYEPQREINLRTRLGEYVRASLEAGIFYES